MSSTTQYLSEMLAFNFYQEWNIRLMFMAEQVGIMLERNLSLDIVNIIFVFYT
jgi:hypothetical protein